MAEEIIATVHDLIVGYETEMAKAGKEINDATFKDYMNSLQGVIKQETKLKEAADEKLKTDRAQAEMLLAQGAIKNQEELIAYSNALTSNNEKALADQRKKAEEEVWAVRKKAVDEVGQTEQEQRDIDAAKAAEQRKLDAEHRAIEHKEKIKNAQEQLKQAKKSGNADQIKTAENNLKDLYKQGSKQQKDEAKAEKRAEAEKKRAELADRTKANLLKKINAGIANLGNAINAAIKSYAEYQGKINARLQGAKVDTFEELIYGKNGLSKVAYSPLLKTSELYSNAKKLIDDGITANVSQIALLETMKDDIISTFDPTQGYIRNLVHIQQEESSAARMGMESYLNRFLNEFVETSEYLCSTFDRVAETLYNASALMSADESAEFEFVVQKWLGSLSGVGLSDSAANSIASAIAALGSGDISNVGSGISNLIIMAASKAGIDYAGALTEGITAADTNQLMSALVTYMQELYNSGNNVVRAQLADVFGVSITDLKSVTNLSTSDITTLTNSMMSYTDMYSELAYQFNQLNVATGRVSVSSLLNNALENYTYQTGISIAASPALNTLWTLTDLVQSVTGGINIPALSAFGTGLDLEATVENLMKIVIVGASTFAQIGGIMNGLSSIENGSVLLDAVGLTSGGTTISRGTGLKTSGKRASGTTQSASTYVGNESSEDYTDSTVNAAVDEQKSDLDVQTEEAKDNDPVVEYLTNLQYESKLNNIAEQVSKLETYLSNISTKSTSIDKNITDLPTKTFKTTFNNNSKTPIWVTGNFSTGGDSSSSVVQDLFNRFDEFADIAVSYWQYESNTTLGWNNMDENGQYTSYVPKNNYEWVQNESDILPQHPGAVDYTTLS